MMNQIATTGPRGAEGRTPVAKLPLNQVKDVRTMLVNDMAKQQLQTVAAKHMNPERMMRLMANAMRTTPKLGECNPLSLLGAMMQCASLGLEPNTVLGHAYLIPFEKKGKNDRTGKWEVVETNVQLIIGYKGMIDLARRSGHITSISANIHYSDDELWDHEEGTEARLRHKPGPQDGEPLHAYAIAKFTDGGHAYVVLPWAKVMKIRDGSQGWQAAVRTAEQYKKPINSPWATHQHEMAQKTAIRALAKYLPLSTEFRDGLESDGARQADYASFAMNPVAGLEVQPDYDMDGSYQDEGQGDEDTGEVAGPAVIGDQRGQELVLEPQREATPVARRSTRTTKAAEPEPAPRDPEPERRQEQQQEGRAVTSGQSDMDLTEQLQRTEDHAKADLDDGADLESTLDMYASRLKWIKERDSGEHDALVAELTRYAGVIEKASKGQRG